MTNHKRWRLYILKLEHDKWYVGITSKTPEERYDQHLRGIWAAEWTKIHKPLSIHAAEDLGELTKIEAEDLEHQKTRELMKIYGWQNVRGGRFRSIAYKKHYGILWRVNTENDMPTIDTLQALHVIFLVLIIVMIQAFLIWR